MLDDYEQITNITTVLFHAYLYLHNMEMNTEPTVIAIQEIFRYLDSNGVSSVDLLKLARG